MPKFNPFTGTLAPSFDLLSALALPEISVTGATTATISRMHVCSGTSANYTVTLPAASGNTGKIIGFRMASGLTKLVTLDGDGSETIDGATTRIMWAGEIALLLCDGTGWVKIAGKSIPSNVHAYLSSTQLNIGSAGYVKVQLGATSVLSGAFQFNAGSYDVTLLRPMNFIATCRVAWAGLTSPTTKDYWTAIYKNGGFAASDFAAPNSSTGPASLLVQNMSGWAANDVAALYAYSPSDSTADVDATGAPAATYIDLLEVPVW